MSRAMSATLLSACLLVSVLPLWAQDIEKVEPPSGATRCVYGEPCGYKDCFCCGACEEPSKLCQVSETRFCVDEPWAVAMQNRAKGRKVRSTNVLN